MDLAKLKVADLKAELAARNLDTKGVKAVLLERLKEALEREANAAGTAVNAGMGGEQQLFQAQHQQMMLQQQMFAQQQQQLYLQQQLQLQQEQQQLLLQQQQQQQQHQQNVIQSEVPPHQEAPPQQDHAIEDLSMPSKRVETPVRRSRRRSATRSPSPTNSLGEHSTPAASLLGSARKRGRSRSMTKSPSPQRLAEVAPSLEAVQEEPEPPVERPLSDTHHETVREESAPVVDTFAAATATAEEPEQATSEEVEPVAAELPCAMETDTDTAPAVVTESVNSEPEESKGHSESVSDQQAEATPKVEPTVAVTEEPSPASEEQPSAVDTHSTEAETKPEPEFGVKQEEPPTAQEVKKDSEDNIKKEKEDDDQEKKADATTAKTEAAAAKDTNGGGSNQGKQSSEAGNKKQSQQNNVIEFVSEEIEPKLGDETDKQNATLSWYDSDLNLNISPDDLLSAKPLADGIFGLVWGGVRANRGVTGGRVFFEVLVGDEMQPATRSPFVPEGETCTPEIRIGWSIQPAASTPRRQLGESDRSYGYANDGQKVLGGTFEKYGGSYGKHDVIGAYLDLESQPCRIQYTLNRVRQGEAYEFDKDSLEGAALFPHIYTKNLAFKVNFGTVAEGFPLTEKKPAEEVKPQEPEKKPTDDATKAEAEEKEPKEGDSGDKEDSEATKEEEEKSAAAAAAEEEQKEVVADSTKVDEKPTPDVTALVENVPFDAEYRFVNEFAKQNEELIVQGHEGPSSRDCCELIMMIGLPGSGKTHWVNKYLADNPETPYTVLSVNSLLENMKVSAQPRDPSNTPQWQKIVEQLSRNTGRLIEIACKRRRNILIDQTNVFASEQKRRLKGFGGFKVRRAIAVVPEVEEYKRRYEQKVAKYGKEVPDSTLNTMKANIFVPSDELKWYTEIVFAELPETEAKEAIKKLNEEGRKLMPPRRNRGQQSNRGPNQKNNGSSNANSGYTSRWNHNHRAQGGSGGQYGGNKTGNRYGGSSGGGSGGYNNRYGNKSNDSHQYGGGGHHHQQQHHHHRTGGDYRSGGGNGYGRRDDHRSGGSYSGGSGGGNRYDSWNRNSGGYYNDRGYSNRGYNQQQDHSNNRYDARRRDRRGYNNGSGWNSQGGQQQQQQQWNNNYGNSGSNDMWYDWWQDH
ncbi:heterogeneous nuclear ribonucleoprotein U-like protein 1 isoform X2 [Anopheles aquasalis]|uniref:heterogeneous nuclear ribonucleoprotein U-like protein 1 isoform X2 n=1 Tax=Anopheles aquasalis TaxID=42839 RepID=UPI00215A6AEA|nr:heterogeneous nuclear ribonucleoprotein U-like protein 1 isoform X2 [Anopheles aquasalis]